MPHVKSGPNPAHQSAARLTFARATQIAAVVVFLLHPAAHVIATAREQSGVIRGRIVGPDSAALSGARVVAAGSAAIATTDSTGAFVLRQAPAGVHIIELWHPDFVTFNLPAVKIPARDTMGLNALLQRRPRAGDPPVTSAEVRGGRGADTSPLVLINGVLFRGVQRPGDTTKMLGPTEVDIVSIEVLTGNAATQRYGSQARTGILSIVTPMVCPRTGPPRRGC